MICVILWFLKKMLPLLYLCLLTGLSFKAEYVNVDKTSSDLIIFQLEIKMNKLRTLCHSLVWLMYNKKIISRCIANDALHLVQYNGKYSENMSHWAQKNKL